jgi:hypothetical protein
MDAKRVINIKIAQRETIKKAGRRKSKSWEIFIEKIRSNISC